MMDKRTSEFSERGRARRDAMLTELVREMETVHRKRRTRLRFVTGSLVLVLLAGTTMVIPRGQTGSPTAPPAPMIAHDDQTPSDEHHNVAEPSIRRMRIETVDDRRMGTIEIASDQPLILTSMVASGTPQRTEFINDEALLATLEEIGRPAGLIRIGDRVLLTDAAIERDTFDSQSQQPGWNDFFRREKR